jgi:alkylation response protein AidB-like acyl-CoA dehydrogenase
MAEAVLPSEQDLVQRARAVGAKARSEALETERAGRTSDALAAQMRDAGFYRVLQPKRFGGFEMGLDVYTQIIRAVAAGDGSVGWTLMTGTMHQWLVALFPEQAQKDIWADGKGNFAAGSYAPSGRAEPSEGGYRLSGQWAFASGIDVADWALLGAMIPQADGPPKPGFMLAPSSDYTIDHGSWHVAGLNGSGSKTIHVKDVFVPAHRSLLFEQASSGQAPGTKTNTNPIYRIPFMACVPICLVAPPIGMAEGAYAVFVEQTRARTTRGAVAGGAKNMAEFPTVQIRVAEAQANIDAAICLLTRDLAETTAFAVEGKAIDVAMRIRNRRDHAFCTKLATQAVDALFLAAGGRGLATEQPLQRFWRDIHAAGVHISLNWDAVGSMVGQFALGLPPQGQY